MVTKGLTPIYTAPDPRHLCGFDVETQLVDGKHHFICCAFWGMQGKIQKHCSSKQETIHYMIWLQRAFKVDFVCTNQRFDVMEIFKGTKELQNLRPFIRNNKILYFEYIYSKDGNDVKSFTMFDTMNFFLMSVEDMGDKLLHLPKLEKPEFLGQRQPQTAQEWQYFRLYNMRDAEISCRVMEQFQAWLNSLGALLLKENDTEDTRVRFAMSKGGKCKNTAASSSMDTFRRLFLTTAYHDLPLEIQQDIFQAYYGGRCEVFQRGTVTDAFLFDINSMYPAVMKYEYPLPTITHIYHEDDMLPSGWLTFKGIVDVTVECPSMDIPLLPIRKEGKLLFPIGKFRGTWTTDEVHEAVTLGYTICCVHKLTLFPETGFPFQEYIDRLYALRLQYQQEGNQAYEQMVKLLMNSLYGRFALKPMKQRTVLPVHGLSSQDLEKMARLGKHIYHPSEWSEWVYIENPSIGYAEKTCPIWSCYVTSYARILLHRLMRQHPQKMIYCDTDSLLTKASYPTSTVLGALKLEWKVEKGYIVKPKMYCIMDGVRIKAKSKGVNLRSATDIIKQRTKKPISREQLFLQMVQLQVAEFEQWTGFGRAQRPYNHQKLDYNQPVHMKKKLSLVDTKRQWPKEFSLDECQQSQPLVISETI